MKPVVLAASAALLLTGTPAAFAQDAMSFFVTSIGLGDGANLGGLEGADAHCQQLAEAAGASGGEWRAYLSADGINARDRIGPGPWSNAVGEVIANSLDELHSDSNNITKASALDETGNPINGRGDEPNQHDVLTGSEADGGLSAGNTCGDWTMNGEGTAMVGHHDRSGPETLPTGTSWNAAHPSRGCSQEALIGTGGNGYFYCFKAD